MTRADEKAGHIPRLTKDQQRILDYVRECEAAEQPFDLDELDPRIEPEDAARAIVLLLVFGLLEKA